jgi:prolipoprotein diacylglyceryltransferase
MSYATGVVPTLPGERVYPTPVFESAVSLAVLLLLSYVERSRTILALPLQRFGLYLASISLERIWVEVFRINPVVLWRFSEAQVIGCVLLLIGVAFLVIPRERPSSV